MVYMHLLYFRLNCTKWNITSAVLHDAFWNFFLHDKDYMKTVYTTTQCYWRHLSEFCQYRWMSAWSCVPIMLCCIFCWISDFCVLLFLLCLFSVSFETVSVSLSLIISVCCFAICRLAEWIIMLPVSCHYADQKINNDLRVKICLATSSRRRCCGERQRIQRQQLSECLSKEGDGEQWRTTWDSLHCRSALYRLQLQQDIRCVSHQSSLIVIAVAGRRWSFPRLH